MADLFVSYARADRARVAPLVAALEAEGWSVWWDPEITPGQEFDRLIAEELDKARAVIVVWTPTSVESLWVRGEAREGRDRGVLAPVRFDNAHLPIDMRAIHTTDLDGWGGDAQKPAFRELVRALRALAPEHVGELDPVEGQASCSKAAPTVPFRGKPWRWRWIAAGGLACIAVATLTVWRFGQPALSSTSIAVQRVTAPAGDAAAQEFADRLAGGLATMAAARPSSLKIVQPAAGAPARFVIGGEARTVGDKITATVNLSSTSDNAIIWSANFNRPVAEAAALPDQAATRLADVLTCALPGGEPEIGDVEVLKLLLAACASVNDPDGGSFESVRDQFHKVVARAPNLARAWGQLALVDANMLTDNEDSPEKVAAYQQFMDMDAAHALRLNPRDARAWAARGLATLGLANWPRRRAYLEKALALDPEQADALTDLQSAWADIGRTQDSLTAQERAADGDPLTSYTLANLAFSQGLAGRPADAKATFDIADRRWPGDPYVSQLRVSYNARLGDAAAVLKVLDGPNPPPTFDAVELQITRLLCQARLDPARSAEAAAFMRTHADGAHLSQAIQGLVQVGRIDEAFDLAEADLNEIRNTQDFTSVFFRPFMAKFLASPRFMPLAARLGLVDIWRKTGLWPDYCSGPTAPYDCKAEAAKAMAKAA